MKPSEAEASMRILRAVAEADATVAADEQRVLGVVAEKTGARADAEGPIDLDRELLRLSSEDAKRLTMRAALAIAAIDGKCTADEHRLLAKVDAAIGGGLDLAEAEAEWTARMAETRRAVAAETDDFLRAVGRASAIAELSPQRYETLLADFEKKKRELMTKAIS
jgi:tellurite resistance protein